MKEETNIQANAPEKRIQKYVLQELWDSLYYVCCDADDNYDGLLHIISTIDGSEIKIAVKDIIHEAAKYQNKI